MCDCVCLCGVSRQSMLLQLLMSLLLVRWCVCVCVWTALLAHQRDANVSHQVQQLRQCISILFAFQRRPTKDRVFVTDTRHWLSRLVRLFLIFFTSCAFLCL